MTVDDITFTIKPAGPVTCRCTANHAPKPTVIDAHHVWPKSAGGPTTPGNLIWLCPTAHRNVHELLDAWHRAGKIAPAQHANRHVLAVAKAGWQAMQTHAVTGPVGE